MAPKLDRSARLEEEQVKMLKSVAKHPSYSYFPLCLKVLMGCLNMEMGHLFFLTFSQKYFHTTKRR